MAGAATLQLHLGLFATFTAAENRSCHKQPMPLPYLIFVIFFTHANFLENKIYTKKCVNYDKTHSKLSIFCVITAKYTVNCQFFALNL